MRLVQPALKARSVALKIASARLLGAGELMKLAMMAPGSITAPGEAPLENPVKT